MPTMTEQPQWLRVSMSALAIGVDRDANVVRGMILAEEGIFKDRRGQFDRQSIHRTVKLAREKPAGLRSRFTHPNLSADGLGRHLGRIKNIRTDKILREIGKDADGKPLMKERLVARGDLHLDKTALEEPVGGGKPLGLYVMDLAETDPDALGASLVLKAEQTTLRDAKGNALKDESGEDLPQHWMPTSLMAADVVDDGAATHSFLSADILASLPDAIVRQGCELLDAQFAGQERDVIKARLTAFVDRYLSHRFGEEEPEEDRNGEPIVNSAGEPVEVELEKQPPIVASDEALRVEMWLAENA